MAPTKSATPKTASRDDFGDDTRKKHRNLKPAWKPGQSGNPAGRPKGARSKLGEAFLKALQQDFAEHGAAVIERVRLTKPDAYLRIIAYLLPRDVNLNVDPFEDLTDADLIQRIRTLNSALELHFPVILDSAGIDPEADENGSEGGLH